MVRLILLETKVSIRLTESEQRPLFFLNFMSRLHGAVLLPLLYIRPWVGA